MASDPYSCEAYEAYRVWVTSVGWSRNDDDRARSANQLSVVFERVRAAVLTGFVEVARFVGLEPFDQLRRSGLNPSELVDQENWLPALPVAQLLERCATDSGRGDFALLMAECRTFSSLGPLSLLLKYQATLKDVITQLKSFRRYLNDVFDAHVETSNGIATLQWTAAPAFYGQQIVSLVAAMGYRAITGAMDGKWLPERAHFPFVAPETASTFRRYFNCDLEFESEFCGLSFPEADLDIENPQADGALSKHASLLLNLMPPPVLTLSDQTRHTVLLLLPEGRASLDTVAKNLSMSPRMLQRQLASEGSTFAGMVEEARRGLALHYLGSRNRPVSHIAELLGYSSTSAFSRWFSDHFGKSPAAWRGQTS